MDNNESDKWTKKAEYFKTSGKELEEAMKKETEFQREGIEELQKQIDSGTYWEGEAVDRLRERAQKLQEEYAKRGININIDPEINEQEVGKHR